MIDSIQKNITWRAVLIAAVIAGTVFLVLNIILTTLLFEADPGLSVRYIASLVMGSEVLTETDPAILVTGVLVNFGLSLIFTLVIAIVVHRWGLLVGIFGGAILGLAIYAINVYTFTLFFQWFFAINSVALVLSHVLFGMVAGGIYELFDHFDLPVFAEERLHD